MLCNQGHVFAIKAMLAVSSDEGSDQETPKEHRYKTGKIIIDPVALATHLSEVMEESLGRIAARWEADPNPQPVEKFKKDKNKIQGR